MEIEEKYGHAAHLAERKRRLSDLSALPAHIPSSDRNLLISNYPVDPAHDIRELTLRPFEARVYRLR